MNSLQTFKTSVRSLIAAAVATTASASDFIQPFNLAAPDSNPAAVLRYGEPGGTPNQPAAPANPTPPPSPPDVAAGPETPDKVATDAPADSPPKPSKKKRSKTPPAPPEPEAPEFDRGDPLHGATSEIRDQAAKLAKEGQRMALQIQREAAIAAEDARRGAKTDKRVMVNYAGARRARTLLLPGDTQTVEERNQLNEDLTVMHRIVSKAAGRRRESEPFHIAFDRPDAPEMDALYLDGYGALFMVSVSFPLVEPEKPKAKEPAEDGKDPVWEETRKRVKASTEVSEDADDTPDAFSGLSAGGGGGSGIKVVQDVVLWTNENEPFDKDRVEALKKKLKASFKHASNIRGLRPEDTVAVVVMGAPTVNGPLTKSFRGGVDPLIIKRYSLGGGAMDSADLGRSRMVLRARKSDIDAFAAGKTDLEQFPVKITVGR